MHSARLLLLLLLPSERKNDNDRAAHAYANDETATPVVSAQDVDGRASKTTYFCKPFCNGLSGRVCCCCFTSSVVAVVPMVVAKKLEAFIAVTMFYPVL